MPLQPNQLVAAATAPPGPAGRGRAAYLLRPNAALTPAERRLADDLFARQAPTLTDLPGVPSVPRKARRQAPRPLDVASVAWLSQLPADPAEVPLDDAQHLAMLAGAVPPGSSDERLVAAHLGPIQAHYAALRDAAVAANERALAPMPPPPSALVAVAEAVRRADPAHISEGEAAARAQTLLDDAAVPTYTTGGDAA